MSIEARAFNLGEPLGTLNGWEYRRCAVVYRRNADGTTEIYGTLDDWDVSPVAIRLHYEAQLVAAHEEIASLKAQLAERTWQPPGPEPEDKRSGDRAVFPNMAHRKNVQLGGPRSGLIIVAVKCDGSMDVT